MGVQASRGFLWRVSDITKHKPRIVLHTYLQLNKT